MRVSKIRNSPRIVLSAARSKSELVQDELLLTDTNSDGFSDNYIVSDYLDGELDDGGQRIFAEELAEAEEFLFTPETNTVSTDVVNIEKVEAGIIDAGSGRTPDMKIYGTTLVNLLGSYGNFETDTNADGLADGWTNDAGLTAVANAIDTTYEIFGSKCQKITLSADGEGGNYAEITVAADEVLFVAGYIKAGDTDTTGELYVDWRDVTDTQISTDSIGTNVTANYTRESAVLTAPANTVKARIYITVAGVTGKLAYFDGIEAINLTTQGALDPVRQQKYGVTNWEDLTEEQLEAEIPYFDSVMSVNVEDGTASELTVENRGKNLVRLDGVINETDSPSRFIPEIILASDIFPGMLSSSIYVEYAVNFAIEGNEVYWEPHTAAYGVGIKVKAKPNTEYVWSVGKTTNVNAIAVTYFDINGNLISADGIPAGIFSLPIITPENCAYMIMRQSCITSQVATRMADIVCEEGTSATDYVPPRTDSITIPDTVELHGFDGVFNYIDSNGNFVKNWEREDKTTDASGAFSLSGYATGSKVICRNKTNGEVEVLDAAASVTTSWTEEDIEILYQLEVPTLTSESLTGAIKLYQGQNNVLSSDSSAPVAINVVNLNNDVTTSTNFVNIENIINTASYEWNSGNLTSWSMSGRSFVNLLHDSEAVPDSYSRHFKSLDGNTYFDYLNETLITGDNTYTFVTNSSGDTASMAVYNLTDLGSLTTLEASAANTLAEESLYDTDTLWEDLPEAILTEMLPPYIAQYTKEYTTSYIKPISNTVEHHEIPIDLPLLGLNSYNNVINSDGTGTEYAKISDLSEGVFTYLDEVDDIDYVEIELDYDLSQELDIPEIGVCWDYSSDVSTLTRRVIDTVVEVVWDYSSDVSTLSRRAI